MIAQRIEVIYLDGTAGQVSNDVLDVLVATGKISQFRRGNGWVDIIRDHACLRDYRQNDDYTGKERRSPWSKKETDTN